MKDINKAYQQELEEILSEASTNIAEGVATGEWNKSYTKQRLQQLIDREVRKARAEEIDTFGDVILEVNKIPSDNAIKFGWLTARLARHMMERAEELKSQGIEWWVSSFCYCP